MVIIPPCTKLLQPSGEVVLRADPGNFTQGKTDVFQVELPDLGPKLERLMVGHKEDGADNDWHLDYILIKNLTISDPPTRFDCGETWTE